jgi:hypothetical protein
MRSRGVKLSCAAVALIALGVAAFFVFRSEQQLAALRADGRTFDLRAREASDALADLRAAQQAYVAAGQGVAFWMPKVAQTAATVDRAVATLRSGATSAGARAAIDQAAAMLADFTEVDGRARDYLRSGQLLMAGDVIFTEGDQVAAAAARQVEAARLAEHQALDASEGEVRRRQALALGSAGGLTAIILLLVSAAGGAKEESAITSLSLAAAIAADRPAVAPPPDTLAASSRAVSPVLKAASQLCTDFARMRDLNDLQLLLARASDVMDAAGLVVWLGSSHGADLEPVLAHGYSDTTRARLPHVPRNANNAAAAAYRSGAVQIVLSRPGGAKGAIVVPILAPDGCIGALSAEIRGGGEASESVQALAIIVAAQLAGVLATNQADVSEPRAAAASS